MKKDAFFGVFAEQNHLFKCLRETGMLYARCMER